MIHDAKMLDTSYQNKIFYAICSKLKSTEKQIEKTVCECVMKWKQPW